jgi:hypothetical protein
MHPLFTWHIMKVGVKSPYIEHVKVLVGEDQDPKKKCIQ